MHCTSLHQFDKSVESQIGSTAEAFYGGFVGRQLVDFSIDTLCESFGSQFFSRGQG